MSSSLEFCHILIYKRILIHESLMSTIQFHHNFETNSRRRKHTDNCWHTSENWNSYIMINFHFLIHLFPAWEKFLNHFYEFYIVGRFLTHTRTLGNCSKNHTGSYMTTLSRAKNICIFHKWHLMHMSVV